MHAIDDGSLDWLLRLQGTYRDRIRQGRFFAMVSAASVPADFRWIRQLYHLSADFTGAVALRYGGCRDDRFRDPFGEHAAEEVTHPADLAAWMRNFGFLGPDEEPTSVAPTLETLAIGSYLVRSAVRDTAPHLVIALNLMCEGIARDLFGAVNPRLAGLGLTPEGYWAAHAKADMRHELLGLELIPACAPDTPCGVAYGRIAWEVASLFYKAFDSWTDLTAAGQSASRSFPNLLAV
jgi:hypothetical protein